MKAFALALGLLLLACACAQDTAAPPAANATNATVSFCSYTVNNRVNMTLSKTTRVPSEICEPLREGLSGAMKARVFEGITDLAAAIRRFGDPNANRSVNCNVTAFEQSLVFPNLTSVDECNAVHIYLDLTGRVAAFKYLDTMRRFMGLPDDPDSVPDEQKQRTNSCTAGSPAISCEFGPYGVSIATWSKEDCADAHVAYARCTSKTQPATRESLFKCFVDATSFIEGSTA